MADGKCFDDEYIRPWSTKVYASQRNFLERIAETMHHPSINVIKIPFSCRFMNDCHSVFRCAPSQVTVQRLIDFVAAKGDADIIFKHIRCKSGVVCNSGVSTCSRLGACRTYLPNYRCICINVWLRNRKSLCDCVQYVGGVLDSCFVE